MSDFPSWALIESDPGVFTELISKMGVRDVQVEEIWCMDAFSIKQLSPVYGLIFLFKWESERQISLEDSEPVDHEDVYFARQIVPNACATQAILSILMNSKDIDLGDDLKAFKAFTRDFPADLKGEMIGNSDLLRTAHNSFSNPCEFISERLSERAKGGHSDDLFHFVSFMPIRDQLYELDGLTCSPRRIEPCTEEDWIEKALENIQKKIDSYGSHELRFSLMAVCADRIKSLEARMFNISLGMRSYRDLDVPVEEMPIVGPVLKTLEELTVFERAKKIKWKKENSLRRHNFIPLFIQLLAEASRSGRLGPMVKQAYADKKECS